MTEDEYAKYDMLCAFLLKFTYKPGWTFQPFLNAWGPAVDIRAAVIDCDDHDKPIIITLQFDIPHHIPDDMYLMRWLRSKIMEVERHEADEFFQFDGVKIFDPH